VGEDALQQPSLGLPGMTRSPREFSLVVEPQTSARALKERGGAKGEHKIPISRCIRHKPPGSGLAAVREVIADRKLSVAGRVDLKSDEPRLVRDYHRIASGRETLDNHLETLTRIRSR